MKTVKYRSRARRLFRYRKWYSMIMISHIPVSCEMGSCPIVHVDTVVYLVGVCSKYQVFIMVRGKVDWVLVSWYKPKK